MSRKKKQLVKCRTCDGEGVILVQFVFGLIEQSCPDCKGCGKVVEKMKEDKPQGIPA